MEDKRFQRMIEKIGALTPAQFKALVQAYGLNPITAPEQDLDAILGERG